MTAFRDQLLEAGVLVAGGSPGVYGRSKAFEDVVTGISGLVRAQAPDSTTTLHFPPVLGRDDFTRTGYLASFPDLIGSLHTFRGGDAEHAALLASYESGEDWTAALVPADVMLCSAACHPLYPTLTGRLDDDRVFDVRGWVFRAEPSLDPARMQAFRQHEMVFVGEAAAAESHRDRWLAVGLDLLTGLGLPVEKVVANDPFFGRAGRILATGQRVEELKFELVCEVANADAPTAITSANLHRDHFGADFAITLPDGSPAHSACIGFGLERITLALLRHHGVSVDAWPASVRQQLAL
ncbi:MAG TPA: amino acid--[acyl-carrier-protein] ligase [Mycobacteriales bacterium]